MVNITIPEFWGTPKEDARRLLRMIDLSFMSQTQFTGQDLQAVKCLTLAEKCKGIAEDWVNKQSELRDEDWEGLKSKFVARFPLQKQTDTMQEALTRLFNLKQNGRPYAEYFEEARNIERDLPKELSLTIPNRLVQGLDNSTLKMLVGALLNQATTMQEGGSKPDLEMTIRLIRGGLGDMDKENQESMTEIDKYRGLKPADRAVTEALERSSKMMSGALEQNAKVVEGMLNKMMSFNRPNPRSNYGQGGNNNPQENRQIQNQNNRTDQGTHHNDENAQVPVPPEAWAQSQNHAQNQGYRQRRNPTAGTPGAGVFRKTNVTCFNCCESGHFSRDCPNPTAPWEERLKVQKDTQDRLSAAAASREPSTGANRTPLGESANSGNATAGTSGGNQQRSGYTNIVDWDESASFKPPKDWLRPNNRLKTRVADAWELGDEYTEIAQSFSCDCESTPSTSKKRYDKEEVMTTEHDDEEVMATKRGAMGASKRTNEEIDDIEGPSRRGDVEPKRILRSVSDLRSRSPNSQSTLTDTTTPNPAGDLATGPVHLAPPIASSSTKGKASVRDSATKGVRSKTPLKPKCLKDGELFDWHNWCNATDITLPLSQLFGMAPRARIGLADAMKVDNPKRKSRQVRFSEGENFEAHAVEGTPYSLTAGTQPLAEEYELDVHAVENARSDLLKKGAGDLIPFSHQDLVYKMAQVMAESGKKDWHIDLARKLGWDPDHLLLKLGLETKTSPNTRSRIVSKNFYTFASLKPRKSPNSEQWDVKKVLIDPGSTLNLISQRVANQIGAIVRSDNSMTMIIANGARVLLPGYTILEITVAGVTRIVQFFVVPGKTSYSMILGRPWLRDVAAIGYYESDEYWIRGLTGDYNKLDVCGPGPNPAKEVCMGECVLTETLPRNRLPVDDEVLVDLDYEQDELANAVLRELEMEAEAEEEWDEMEMGEFEEESGEGQAL